MTIRHDVPRWANFDTPSVVAYRARIAHFMTTPEGKSWRVGEIVLAGIDRELERRANQ